MSRRTFAPPRFAICWTENCGAAFFAHLISPEARPSVASGLRRRPPECSNAFARNVGVARDFWAPSFPRRLSGPVPRHHNLRPSPATSSTSYQSGGTMPTVRSEVITAYESRLGRSGCGENGDISGRLQSGSEDHWLALLVLGACRSLGRTRHHQHRGFLDFVHERGWWDVFKAPDDERAWMQVLRDWQDGASAELTYAQWMSLFPAIYQLSRYRKVYVRLLKSAGQRPATELYDITRLA